jgi:cytochrome c553
MKSIVIPNADVVWHVAQEAPKDDNEWIAVQNSALTVAEAGNLLMIGGRSKDQGNWVKAAQALVDAATVALRAAQAKNVDALNEAGDRLVTVCGNCHRQYKQSPR